MNVPFVTDPIDAELYVRYPALCRAEVAADFRNEVRREILELLPKGGIGVELGVFAGCFSRVLLQVAQPRILHLVDPWWKVFGTTYPDWGAYTDHGRLETRAAHDAAIARSEAARGHSSFHVHVDTSIAWLQRLPDEHLDWAYLDTTHTYDDTLTELNLLAEKVSSNGFIVGDDYWTDPSSFHYGVVRAVHAFLRQQPYVIIRADRYQQFALQRRPL
jgi:hypothetical protein